MGKAGNKSRRAREAAARRLKELEQDAAKVRVEEQERIEMERAYGAALADGEFEDDFGRRIEVDRRPGTDVVPWKDLEDPAFKQDEVPPMIPTRDRWRVTIMEDHNLEYPELNMEVFVCGTKFDEPHFAEMFARSGCRQAKTMDNADLVVFTGGPDVQPSLYGHDQWTGRMPTRPQPSRDDTDKLAFDYCLQQGIPMFGVCRGMQYIHVRMGGTLFQDVDGHFGDHSIFDARGRRTIDRVSSTHHQMVMPNPTGGMEVIAWNQGKAGNRKFWSKKDQNFVSVIGPKVDIEAAWYRDICAFLVQGHPEYRTYNAYTIWCLDQIYTLIRCNPDIDCDTGPYRIKKTILEQRKFFEGV